MLTEGMGGSFLLSAASSRRSIAAILKGDVFWKRQAINIQSVEV